MLCPTKGSGRRRPTEYHHVETGDFQSQGSSGWSRRHRRHCVYHSDLVSFLAFLSQSHFSVFLLLTLFYVIRSWSEKCFQWVWKNQKPSGTLKCRASEAWDLLVQGFGPSSTAAPGTYSRELARSATDELRLKPALQYRIAGNSLTHCSKAKPKYHLENVLSRLASKCSCS